jgi:PIN domain nuclease of toxin-antitoxin system
MTVWELAVLFARGRVRASGTVEASVRLVLEEVTVLPITPEIAALATQFPEDYPGDPSDRIIGATARAGGMTLLTHDERIRRSTLIRTAW